jgi:hypothetical protein
MPDVVHVRFPMVSSHYGHQIWYMSERCITHAPVVLRFPLSLVYIAASLSTITLRLVIFLPLPFLKVLLKRIHKRREKVAAPVCIHCPN